MNDEIKEILDYMKQYVENIYEHDSEPMLNWKDLKKLLDYITNLQEENDRLNNIINELEKDTIELMKSYKDVNAPRYDMCKHFIYKLKELKENKQ